MNRRSIVSVLCCVALCLCAAARRDDEAAAPAAAAAAAPAAAPAKADLRSALVGTWKMTSMKVNGEENTLPDSAVTLKHVTPGGFTWLSYRAESGEVFRSAGGSYTLAGDDYAETIEYGAGSDFQAIKGAAHAFKCRIEGDTWYHTGKLANGTELEEVWTRVKPAGAKGPAGARKPADAKKPADAASPRKS